MTSTIAFGEPVSEQISVVILTFNEEKNLPHCLQAVRSLASPVFVVDSGSTDQSVAMAREAGASVHIHPFTTHAEQWAWSLKNLPLQTPWVLAIDADQRVTPQLAQSIRDFVASDRRSNGAYVCRKQIFRGKWIRHGGYYPKYLLKLFRLSAVDVDCRDRVDHHFIVPEPTVKLKGDLEEANLNEDDISVWTQKHTRYARLQAEQEVFGDGAIPAGLRTPDQRTALQKRVWNRLPLFGRSFAYFLYRYFLRAGFLDGREGLIFHFLQGCWYRFLVDVHVQSLRSNGARRVSRPGGL
jgi:glycosyltransferase involved in cell wall biosynthesis